MSDTPVLTQVFMPMVVRNTRRVALGTCVHPSRFADARFDGLVKAHYERITPEVAGGYWWVYGTSNDGPHGWGDMDKIMAYAVANGKRVHYHCLRWWWEDQPVETLKWIEEAMGRYPLIADWTVVNEGYWDGEPTIPLIEESFYHARQVNRVAVLEYNGLFIQDSEGWMVLAMIDGGVPIDQVGIQMHLSVGDDVGRFRPFIERLVGRGMAWRVSELDVAIPEYNAYYLAAQAEQYRRVVELVQELGGEVLGMWGVGDADSWLPPALHQDDLG